MPETPGFTNDWFVVRTQTNRERYAADNIARSGATLYLPEVIELVRKTVRGRRVRVQHRRPLFPGYIFARTGGQWRFLLSTFGVIGLVMGSEGFPSVLPSRLIAQIRDREGVSGLVELPRKPQFDEGQRIRVSSGMFSGFYGSYVGLHREASAAERVKALLDYMGRKVLFLLEEDAIVEAA